MLLPHWANIRVGEGLSWPPHKLLTPDMTRSAPAAPQFYTQLRFFSHAHNCATDGENSQTVEIETGRWRVRSVIKGNPLPISALHVY
jgi:hypothetical protein